MTSDEQGLPIVEVESTKQNRAVVFHGSSLQQSAILVRHSSFKSGESVILVCYTRDEALRMGKEWKLRGGGYSGPVDFDPKEPPIRTPDISMKRYSDDK